MKTMAWGRADQSFGGDGAARAPGRLARWSRHIFSPVSLCLFGGLALYAAVLKPDRVIAALPATAMMFKALNISANPAKAQFSDIQARRMTENGEERLVVEGIIENLSRQPNHVRDLKLTLLGDHGQASFSWIAKLPQAEIKGGARMNFKTSLSAPPAGRFALAVEFVR